MLKEFTDGNDVLEGGGVAGTALYGGDKRRKMAKLITGVDRKFIDACFQPLFLLRQTPIADALTSYLARTAAPVALLIKLPDLLPGT